MGSMVIAALLNLVVSEQYSYGVSDDGPYKIPRTLEYK